MNTTREWFVALSALCNRQATKQQTWHLTLELLHHTEATSNCNNYDAGYVTVKRAMPATVMN